MKQTLAFLLTLAAVLGAAPVSAQTNGFVLHCLSARTAGQGCVARAQADNPTTLFRDPASLVAFDGPRLEVNFAPFAPFLSFDNAVNDGTDGSRHAYPLASAAWVGPRIDGRLAWGVGVEPIGGFGSDFHLRHELLSGDDGALLHYQSFFAALKAGPALAMEVAPGLSIGASASLLWEEIRDFSMPFTMPPTAAPGMAAIPGLDPAVYGPLFAGIGEVTAYGDSEGYSGFGWTADLGARWSHSSGLVIAASWSPQRSVEVDGGRATIDMSAQFGRMMTAMVQARSAAYGESAGTAQAAVVEQLTAAGLDLGAGMTGTYRAATEITLPMTAGVGATLPVGPSLVLAAEAEWRRWSKAESTMPFRLTGGDNPNLNLMMGGNPADGSFTYPFPLDWTDSWSGKLGASWLLQSGNVLRAGVIHGENPVPDYTVFITFPAISTTAVTVGTTWSVGGFPIDLAYVHAFEKEMAACDDGHLLGAEYVGSRMAMGQNVLTLGTRIGFD